MSKLSKQDKIEIYNRRQQGESISQLSMRFGVNQSTINYLIRLISFHGLSILDKDGNRYYSKETKTQILNEVLIQGQSVYSVSIKYGLLSDGMLTNWIRQYRENGYTIVEKTRGRKSTMKKTTKPYNEMTDAEKVAYLEYKNLYLEAENEYLKKLDALIQKKNRQKQLKKKSQ